MSLFLFKIQNNLLMGLISVRLDDERIKISLPPRVRVPRVEKQWSTGLK
jgi:hypothetical protein